MGTSGAVGVGLAALSNRELEVLRGLGDHRTNREIAQLLHISERTVESHVSSLLRKLAATDRRALAAIARRASGDSEARGFRGLPAAWTSFLGRKAEVERVTTSLAHHRLVTVLGPGGIGKTRLAAVAAAVVGPRFRGGGAFVDLVPVAGDQVDQAVAWTLGVAEQPGMPLAAGVEQALNAGPALVVLDNCEHVLGAAAAWVTATLAACPDVTVLCTSRERLHVPGERVVVVPPMGDEARSLFLERAAENDALVSSAALDVDDLCRRLDGNPLAIELAAARLSSLGVDGLRSGLEDQLRLLTRSTSAIGRPADRHGSLRAVLGWSHELLSDDERMAFRRLAVFAGVTDLDAAAAVMPDSEPGTVADLVGRLTDKSLLHRTSAGDGMTSRWRMLDTVRSYGLDRLADSGEGAWIEAQRLRWAAFAAEQLESALVADDAWEERFGEIADDLRAALAGDAPPDLQDRRHSLGMSLGHLVYARFLLTEAYSHYTTAAEAAAGSKAAVAAWRSAAAVARTDQRLDRSLSCLERAAAAAEPIGDRAAQARALADMARLMGRFPSGLEHAPERDYARELVNRAQGLDVGDDPAVAASIALAAAWNQPHRATEPASHLAQVALDLAQQADEPILISDALDALASAATFAGSHQEAARLTVERLHLLDRMPRHDPEVGLEVFDLHHSITETALAAGEPEAAVSAARRSRSDPLYRAVPYHANSRMALAMVLLGEFDEAIVCARDARDGWVRSGRPTAGWMANAFFGAALVEGLRGSWSDFDDWWALAHELARRSSTNEMPGFVALRLALHTGRAATTILGDDPVLAEGRLGDYSRAVAAELAVARGDVHAAASVPFSENRYAAAFSERARGRVEHGSRRLDRAVESWDRLGARFEKGVTLTLLPRRRAEGARMLAELGCTPPATPPPAHDGRPLPTPAPIDRDTPV